MNAVGFCYEAGIVLNGFSEEDKTKICNEAWAQHPQDYNFTFVMASIKNIAKRYRRRYEK